MLIPFQELITEELNQLEQEGMDITPIRLELERFLFTDWEQAYKLQALFDDAPKKSAFSYSEPSQWAEIQQHWTTLAVLDSYRGSDQECYDRLYGGWLGRCVGCALGKPVEGWNSHEEIWDYLKGADAYPLDNYIPWNSLYDKRKADCKASTREHIQYMENDDDINYTIIGKMLLEKYGDKFTPDHVSQIWMQYLPLFCVFTAEHRAYVNRAIGIPAEQCATFMNPYREWIGAQIRADFFGYIAPGDPARAARMAYQDASFSHTKNGIYGEMWVAAMLAAAYTCDSPERIIQVGMSHIPKTSRLFEALENVIQWWKQYETWEETFRQIREQYGFYHWIHTIPNACYVAASLLYGDGDFEKTVCYAVMAGADTDCNGATAGSVVGIVRGAHALPAKWTTPLHDTIHSYVVGYGEVRISDLAQHTLALLARN
jgi:ADP-ribosylglycohydrolase